ncbi:hypothetical protein V2G26_013883 [Clonostachys chloroleuca]
MPRSSSRDEYPDLECAFPLRAPTQSAEHYPPPPQHLAPNGGCYRASSEATWIATHRLKADNIVFQWNCQLARQCIITPPCNVPCWIPPTWQGFSRLHPGAAFLGADEAHSVPLEGRE